MLRLNRRTALITGGAGGLGSAIVDLFGKAGALMKRHPPAADDRLQISVR
jgi:NAD(P)-dependent dehydrogenase (short-subunit alcohol dehydrogenase family)